MPLFQQFREIFPEAAPTNCDRWLDRVTKQQPPRLDTRSRQHPPAIRTAGMVPPKLSLKKRGGRSRSGSRSSQRIAGEAAPPSSLPERGRPRSPIKSPSSGDTVPDSSSINATSPNRQPSALPRPEHAFNPRDDLRPSIYLANQSPTRTPSSGQPSLSTAASEPTLTHTDSSPFDSSVVSLRECSVRGSDLPAISENEESVYSKSSANHQSEGRGKSTRSRSSSPAKRTHPAQLFHLPRKPKVHLDFNPNLLAPHVVKLWNRLAAIALHENFLPSAVKDHKEELQVPTSVKDDWLYISGKTMTNGQAIAQMEEMIKISKLSKGHQQKSVDETDWNINIHSIILKAAAKQVSGVYVKPMGYVSPNPAYISKEKSGISGTANKVDFALLCESSIIPEDLVEEALIHDSCINHTSPTSNDADLMYKPIAVSIETKNPDGPINRAIAQLTSWAMIHFTCLRTRMRLGPDGVVDMPLPLLMVIGGRWILLLAVDGKDTTTIFQSPVPFGDTITPLGAYQVSAGLIAVMEWVKEFWVPWYRKNCLFNAPCWGKKCFGVCVGDECEPLLPWTPML